MQRTSQSCWVIQLRIIPRRLLIEFALKLAMRNLSSIVIGFVKHGTGAFLTISHLAASAASHAPFEDWRSNHSSDDNHYYYYRECGLLYYGLAIVNHFTAVCGEDQAYFASWNHSDAYGDTV